MDRRQLHGAKPDDSTILALSLWQMGRRKWSSLSSCRNSKIHVKCFHLSWMHMWMYMFTCKSATVSLSFGTFASFSAVWDSEFNSGSLFSLNGTSLWSLGFVEGLDLADMSLVFVNIFYLYQLKLRIRAIWVVSLPIIHHNFLPPLLEWTQVGKYETNVTFIWFSQLHTCKSGN